MRRLRPKTFKGKYEEQTPNMWAGLMSNFEIENYGQIFYIGNEDFYTIGDIRQLDSLIKYLINVRKYVNNREIQ